MKIKNRDFLPEREHAAELQWPLIWEIKKQQLEWDAPQLASSALNVQVFAFLPPQITQNKYINK